MEASTLQSVSPVDRRFRVMAELRNLTRVEVMAELKEGAGHMDDCTECFR